MSTLHGQGAVGVPVVLGASRSVMSTSCRRGAVAESEWRVMSGASAVLSSSAIGSISRLSISSLRSKPGHFWFAAGDGGVYLCFVGGWGRESAEGVRSALGGRLDVWPGVAEVWRFRRLARNHQIQGATRHR